MGLLQNAGYQMVLLANQLRQIIRYNPTKLIYCFRVAFWFKASKNKQLK